MNGNKNAYYDKLDFFKWQLGYVIDQIKLADAKINFLLVVYLALLSVVFTQIDKIIDILFNPNVWLGWKTMSVIICLCLFACIIKFFHFFINTVKPRTELEKIMDIKNYKSLIFWRDVANMEYDDFKNTPLEKRYDDLDKQIFINSFIANTKFENVKNAYKLLVPTLIFLLILIGLIQIIGR